ncbi:hypothetical protein [Chitinophaga sp.]|uniref:hypothetical protein n=1 Tax=Chitinophaga sp. TaxID=1869181 RepID=UPI0031DCC537
MKSANNNPLGNMLNPGISDSDIEKAISRSGYPLQTIIANKLRGNFFCQEEWSYLDRNTKEIRSLDIMATCRLFDITERQPRVRPTLNLLIECKQSELPYVFFLSPESIITNSYPNISGLFHKSIKIFTDDSPSTWTMPILHALELSEDNFLINSAPSSMTFSKCVRAGKEIVLSGNESYQSLVQPLISSLLHFDQTERPPESAVYFDAHLPFAIGVLDAPMIGVTVHDNSQETIFLPWIRVFRHESYEHKNSFERSKTYAMDLVHKDFFETFIEKHLLPFASKYADLIIKHDNELAEGRGFAKGLEENSWDNIEKRLEIYSKKKRYSGKFKKCT